MNRFCLIQYNCGGSNNGRSRAFFDSVSHADIIAVQEPRHRHNSTYCPKAYDLSYDPKPETGVCFMIRKGAGVSQWSRKQYGPDVAALRITQGGVLTVINVYSRYTTGPRLIVWRQLIQALNEAEGEIILLGDFNAHHPTWGGRGARCDHAAESLRVETQRRGMSLLLPPGTITWKRGSMQSTIDLAYATWATSSRLVSCKARDEWALTEDHIPVEIVLLATKEAQVYRERFATDKLQTEDLRLALQATRWEEGDSPLQSLQTQLLRLLPEYCPKVRPAQQSRPDWSPEATRLLAAARRARREYSATHIDTYLEAHKRLSGQLKKEVQRVSRANWRRLVGELSTRTEGRKALLWRIARWSKTRAGEAHEDAQMPALRRATDETLTEDNYQKDAILAEKFFPGRGSTRLPQGQPAIYTLPTSDLVTSEEVLTVLVRLPKRKAPGPDKIPNEVWTALAPTIAAGLAHACNIVFATGELPSTLKESITIALRKGGKSDYSLPSSYRPIALENTIAKVVEKILANRLSTAAEAQGLLPWNQMGGRKHRSTESALELLTSCVQTAWKARPGCVVSMLSLDLAGAFDNVNQEVLLRILRRKGIPEWTIAMVASFLHGRRTRIAYANHTGEWMDVDGGIPQGSPVSPILFLYFIAPLLEDLQGDGDTLGIGFIDDTNLVTWGASAQQNCRTLAAAHEKCLRWAVDSGAKFAPEKYQLIHFTRNRRHNCDDLASRLQIGGQSIAPQRSVRMLGVWLDPALSWKEHIAQVARKGLAVSEALQRLAMSTWGPSLRNTRLLYTAVTRPTITYGLSAWGVRSAGEEQYRSVVKPLAEVQKIALRRAIGAYKRTPTAIVEREIGVIPLDLYLREASYKRAIRTSQIDATHDIAKAADRVWAGMRRRGARESQRPQTAREAVRRRAAQIVNDEKECREAQRLSRYRRRGIAAPEAQERLTDVAVIRQRIYKEWKERWIKAREQRGPGRQPVAWTTPWEQDPRKLYAGLAKAQSTALVLMRTEVVGLNAWLTLVGVPEMIPQCACGWYAQTVRHVLLHCPRFDRTELLRRCQTENMEEILGDTRRAAHAARWWIASSVLAQFKVAKEIEEEDTREYGPPEDVRSW